MERYDIKIPYVEIRDLNARNILGTIEGAEIFFEYAGHGVGDFEIYCRSTPKTRNLLKVDRMVTLPTQAGEDTTVNAWVINSVHKDNSETGGRYITATGKEIKSLLDRRIVRYTTVLKGGELLANEVRDKILTPNVISPTNDLRRFSGFVFGSSTVTKMLDEDTQVTWEPVLDYTEALLPTYNCAAKVRFNKNTKNFEYTIYEGVDRSDKVVFSQANENLLSSNFVEDYTDYKTSVLVGGEEKEIVIDEDGNEQEVETGVRTIVEIPCDKSGFARRELFVDAKDLQSEYENENGEKQKMSSTEYNAVLAQRGRETQVEEHSPKVTFEGEIDTTNRRYQFNTHYGLYDLVKLRDEDEMIEHKVRVQKFIKVQNSEGYKEYFEYEEVANVE